MSLKKIQDIKFNNYVELEPLIPMYCRSDVPIQTVEDGAAKLNAGVGFDFLTYFNSLPVGKWRKYTKAEKYFLVLEVKGKFNLDIFGHLPRENNYQKEWAGRYFYDINEKTIIVIPIPKTMKSDVVAFGIGVHNDTYVYDAYYAVDIDEDIQKSVEISIVTNITEDNSGFYKNISLIKEEIFEKKGFSSHFDWIIFDIGENLSSDYSSDKIHIIQKTEDLEKTQLAGDYVVVADEAAVLHADSFKRLYVFLSLLKDNYADYELIGEVFRDEKQNIMSYAIMDNDAKNKSVINSLNKIKDLDMGIWVNVIENECGDFEDSFIPGFFYCIPASEFNYDILFEPDNEFKSGYSVLRSKEKQISVSGICTWISDFKKRVEKSRLHHEGDKQIVTLQDLVLPGEIEIEVTKNMYYRSAGRIIFGKSEEEKTTSYSFINNNFYDFFTYFNAFSLEKWKKYTYVDNVYLRLEVKGAFDINLFGHFKSKVGYQKEWLGEYSFDIAEKEEIIIKYPKGMQSSLISFGINARRDFKIFKAGYVTEVDMSKVNNPLISMVTTTFKKESFIERNIELLSEQLLEEPEYKDNFYWYIIDNGRSVVPPDDLDEHIKIIPNPNVGGAGGFARGQMESIRGDGDVTHILFMDDDVVFIPDSFKKLCNFLKVIKDEYKDYFISGAMLKTGQPNIQHENTGWLNNLGNNESLNTNFDLNLWDVIINNEEINDSIPNRFAAFWFCCVPTTVATLENLPLPVFFRGDDIEYSLRNKAKIITMNGLCIWHEGFEGRFSASLDFYLTVRNKLMLCAINEHLNEIDMIGNIVDNFWEEMRKYDYKGASFFLDAVEDFLKGPDFYKKTNGEANMKEKKAQDNKLKPINPEIRAKIDFERLYQAEPLSDSDMEKYEETCNLQDTADTKKASSTGNVNEKTMYGSKSGFGKYNKKKIGVIPYGWGTWPSKVYKMDEVIAVDWANDTYIIYKKDKDEYERLKKRFETIIKNYEKKGEKIIQEYKDARAELSGEKFWKAYLGKK